MMRQAIRANYSQTILIGLALTLALSANVAWAAHQLVEEKKGVITLQPTKAAGDATGRVEYELVKEKEGSQDSVTLNGVVQIEGLVNPEDVEVFVVNEEGGRPISLGRLDKNSELEGDVSVPSDRLKDLKAFDSIKIVRQSGTGDKDRVLFTAELPHSTR